MKCKILIVQNVKPGSPWPVLECGGAYADNGDSIVVDASIAARMLAAHPSHLKDGGDCERDGLSGGHYAIESGDAKPAPAPKPKPKADDDGESADSVSAKTPADKADDRSMADRGRRKKVKKK